MFKKIWDNIRDWFGDTRVKEIAEVRAFAKAEYHRLAVMVRSANSLAKLLVVRKEIREFQQYLITNQEEYWGRTLVIDLNKFWTAKYEYWKMKTRGL